MVTGIRLVGLAVAVAAGIGGLGVLSGGEVAPAMAAPVAAGPTIAAAAVPDPAPIAAVQATSDKPATDCPKQPWPYVAHECLSAVEGTPARKVTRVVTTIR